MVKKTGSPNPQLQGLIRMLKKHSSESNAKVWKRIANDLEAPSRIRKIVNLYKIEKFAKDNEIIVVPGKVLGSGDVSKKLSIAAYSFSDSAKEKITKAKGEALSISELLEKNPKVQNLRIMG